MDESTGYRRLACAIMLRAYHDAEGGNGHSQDAWGFLESPGAEYLVDLLELVPEGLDYALGTLPKPDYRQLELFKEGQVS